jgi:dTDP-4-amino-4,6-dideoxygalactose transaminase
MQIAYEAALKPPVTFPRRSATALNRLETRNWDLIAALVDFQGDAALEVLRNQIREMSGREHVIFAPSARSAIARVLSLLPETAVVLPAWTCAVVRRSAEIAGKEIIYVDVDRTSLNATSYQFEKVARPGRVLLPTHLFGIPTDIVRTCEIAQDRGCVTVEDAAGAFPARLGNRLLGTFGDVGIISFERSKRVPSFRGAAIIINNDKVFDFAKIAPAASPATRSFPIREVLSSFVHNVGTIPWFYGRVAVPRILREYRSKPVVNQKSTFPATQPDPFFSQEFHPYQAALITRVLKRIDAIHAHISSLVAIYQNGFKNSSIQTFMPPECDTGGLLRFPIAFPGVERTQVLRAALSRGVVLETNYERPLPDESDLRAFPASLWASNNVVLLPLYSSLSLDAAHRIASDMLAIAQELGVVSVAHARLAMLG